MFSAKGLQLVLVLMMLVSGLAVTQPAQAQSIVTITYTRNADKIIADAEGPPASSVTTQDILHVADMGRIIDIDVSVDITHDYVFDLGLELEHGGTTVELLRNVDDNCDDFDLTFDDDAAAPLPGTCDAATPGYPKYPSGTYMPSGSLADFNDMELSGPWTLSITDYYPEGDGRDNGGFLTSWSITVTFEVAAIITGGDNSTYEGPFFFTDGRVNKFDIWAPSAIYCNAFGIDVYAIDADGHGSLAFRATPEEIAAVGIPPADATPEQMLIKQVMDTRLYRLPDGQFQVNTPAGDDLNGYVYTWEGCSF